ncbi:MAG: YdeI/OmpD-associated family protein [Dehalococcoidia bacterium]
MTDLETGPDGRPMVHPLSRAEWREWLEANQERPAGVWLASYKKAAGKPRMEYEEVVEELLCFGWIDSTAGTIDAERSLLWCAPRKPRSNWSRPNKVRVERLQAAGLIAPRGLAVIAAAQANGTWNALDEVEDLIVPGDLAAALAGRGARERWDGMGRSARRAVLEWLVNAKRPETRARRVAAAAEAALEGKAANEWKPKA